MSIGIVLDGDNKGCGINVRDENQYFYNSDGDFDDKNDVRMTVIRFENIPYYVGDAGDYRVGHFSSKDLKPIEGKNFYYYEYFSVFLNGKDTTILIEKTR